MSQLRAIDILKKAYADKCLEVEFEIPYYGKVKMAAPDMFAISEEQEEIKETKYDELVAKGFEDRKVNEAEWQKELNQVLKNIKPESFDKEEDYFKAVQTAKENRPANRADQLAEKRSKMQTILYLIPKFLRDAITNKLLFQTVEEQREFAELIKKDMSLFRMLTEKYVELVTKMGMMSEEAKNSSKPEKSKNSGSSNMLPEDTATQDHLTLV